MALTRKLLKSMGIEDEKVEQIIDAHTEVTDALKSERDQYKEAAEKLPSVQKELDTLKKAAEEADGKDAWKVKYDALKEEYDDYKTQQTEKETKATKQKAYRELLKEVGISEKRLDAVLRVSDVDSIKLDSNGKIENSDELKKSIKDEWSDFIVTTHKEGANPATPPSSTSGSSKTKAEIMAIKDKGERLKAIAENPTVFGLPANN